MKCLKWACLVVCLWLIGAGCENSLVDSRSYRLPVGYENQEVSYQLVSLSSLAHPLIMEGSAARVHLNRPLTERGLIGSRMRIQAVFDDGAWTPTNTISTLAASLYYWMEQLQTFDRDLKIEGELAWPRSLGFYTEVQPDLKGLNNNAFYIPGLDLMIFTPYLSDRLPIVSNPFVISHEHFHSHFESLLNQSSQKKVLSVCREELTSQGLSPETGNLMFSNVGCFSLRALNEGLADFYASSFTRNPRGIAHSLELPGKQLMNGVAVSKRDLEGPLQPFRGLEQIRNLIKVKGEKSSADLQKQAGQVLGSTYTEGTLLARFFYRHFQRFLKLAGKSAGTERIQFLGNFHIFLKSWLNRSWSQEDKFKDFTLEAFLFDWAILESQNGFLRPETCGELKQLLSVERFSQVEVCP